MIFVNSVYWQLLATTIVAGISLLLALVIGRLFGPEEYGTLNYILSLITIYSILMDGGYKTIVYREGVNNPDHEAAVSSENILYLGIINNVIFSVVGLLIILFIFEQNKLAIMLCIGCFSLQTVYVFLSSKLRADGLFREEALWQLSQRIITAAFILLFIYLLGFHVFNYMLGWLVGLCILMLSSPAKILFGIQATSIKVNLLHTSLFLIAVDISTAIYFRADIVMLEMLQDDKALVGKYSAYFKILEALILLTSPIALILFREMRLKYSGSTLAPYIFKNMGLVLPLGLILSLAAFIFGDLVIKYTYGESFLVNGSLAGILGASLIVVLPNAVLTQGVLAAGREKYYAAAAAFTAIFNIGMNYLLIPSMGISGAAWATLLTEVMLMIMLVIALLAFHSSACQEDGVLE